MHDLKFIRQNKEVFDQGLELRGLEPMGEEILALDKEHRDILTELQALQAQRNKIAQAVGEAKKNKQPAEKLMEEAETVKRRITNLEEREEALKVSLVALLENLPNLPQPDVPRGLDEKDNVEIRRVGEPRLMDFQPGSHEIIGEALGLMDFETAAKISGSRFVMLYEGLARLERALAAFMIDEHTKKYGYKEVYVPLLVTEKSMYGTGQLPKLREDMFQTNMGHWLIPTSEVVLTNIGADHIFNESELPLRFTSYTPCFRAEAGAAGRDTKGMIRQHQFGKVEMVTLCKAEESAQELERMTEAAENILQKLELPYRVVTLCTGDMGFNAAKTYDIEVWIPSQNTYREISSCSNCRDFQGRRMNGRYRPTPTKESPKPSPVFLHTLNGSGLAVGRTIVAILENYQQEDGTVLIPEILKPYMNGLEVLKKIA